MDHTTQEIFYKLELVSMERKHLSPVSGAKKETWKSRNIKTKNNVAVIIWFHLHCTLYSHINIMRKVRCGSLANECRLPTRPAIYHFEKHARNYRFERNQRQFGEITITISTSTSKRRKIFWCVPLAQFRPSFVSYQDFEHQVNRGPFQWKLKTFTLDTISLLSSCWFHPSLFPNSHFNRNSFASICVAIGFGSIFFLSQKSKCIIDYDGFFLCFCCA